MLNSKNAKGYAVLAIIFRMKGDTEMSKYHIEPYLNGRESGFCIWDFRLQRKVAFSECRNDDSIVVYAGKDSEFSMQGNGLSETLYRAGRHFDGDAFVAAAEYAVAFLDAPEDS